MKDKTLIAFSTYNSPWFLETLVDSFSVYDAGAAHDVLIMDHSSSNPKQLKLLDKYSKNHKVVSRPNLGRAQGGYNFAWQENKDYSHYLFLHDDSCIIRDNWLKVLIDKMGDKRLEAGVPEEVGRLPVGKVGYMAYPWGTNYEYLIEKSRCLFYYMDPIANILDIKIPKYYQHISDDKYLIKNGLLQKMDHIWNVESFRQMKDTIQFKEIDKFFEANLPNISPFAPDEIYGPRYNAFQTVTEFLSDVAPMRYGYRTHCALGDGYYQDGIGWSSFWGHEYICHYGSHNLFKRLAILLNADEDLVRSRFRDKTFLKICNRIIKKETENAAK